MDLHGAANPGLQESEPASGRPGMEAECAEQIFLRGPVTPKLVEISGGGKEFLSVYPGMLAKKFPVLLRDGHEGQRIAVPVPGNAVTGDIGNDDRAVGKENSCSHGQAEHKLPVFVIWEALVERSRLLDDVRSGK